MSYFGGLGWFFQRLIFALMSRCANTANKIPTRLKFFIGNKEQYDSYVYTEIVCIYSVDFARFKFAFIYFSHSSLVFVEIEHGFALSLWIVSICIWIRNICMFFFALRLVQKSNMKSQKDRTSFGIFNTEPWPRDLWFLVYESHLNPLNHCCREIQITDMLLARVFIKFESAATRTCREKKLNHNFERNECPIIYHT